MESKTRYEDVIAALRCAGIKLAFAKTLVAVYAPLVVRLSGEGDAADIIAADVAGRYVFDCNNGSKRL